MEITDEVLKKINRYSVKQLNADEVFCFSIILCDNDIDRDTEKFTKKSLEQLGELFKGRTGILDHNPRCENQQARIFDTFVKDGEIYCALQGLAYMVRTDENKDFISEIEGGIKKEVSVSCKMEKRVCSVCGADLNTNPCMHIKGENYGGKLCYTLLENPLDAYEWSFVAVPAQKNAGVTKKSCTADGTIAKNIKGDDEKRTELEKDILRLSYFAKPFENAFKVSEAMKNLDIESLEILRKNLEKQTEDYNPGSFISQPDYDEEQENENLYKL